MHPYVVPVGLFQANCYIFVEEDHALVIDPGDGRGMIKKLLDQRAAKVDAVLVTHGHRDHFTDATYFACPVVYPKNDVAYLDDPLATAGHWDLSDTEPFKLALRERGILLEDGDTFSWRGLSFQAIGVSGHTAQSLCYYEPTQQQLYSGDTLFCMSIGRTDLVRLPSDTLRRQIKDKLLVLPADVTVLPGHGEITTIGQEQAENPYLNGNDDV